MTNTNQRIGSQSIVVAAAENLMRCMQFRADKNGKESSFCQECSGMFGVFVNKVDRALPGHLAAQFLTLF